MAKNREGEATNTLTLNVTAKAAAAVEQKAKEEKQAPMVVKPLTPTVCKVGDDVMLEAVITGKPKPSLQWFHNDKPLEGSPSLKMVQKDTIASIVISKAEQIHDGDYMITADNEAGTVQTSANLSVQGN